MRTTHECCTQRWRRRLRAPPDRVGARQQTAAEQVTIDGDDIGGVVTSENGPEAGVWVIAETKDKGRQRSDEQGRTFPASP